jgi:hypothetical protein
MGQSSQEAGKKGPSAKSLNELMELLLKLNAKLREKISPRRRKEESEAGNTEMMIIIFNTSSENNPRAPRAEKGKPKPLKGNWIDDLCEEIEGGSENGKKS